MDRSIALESAPGSSLRSREPTSYKPERFQVSSIWLVVSKVKPLSGNGGNAAGPNLEVEAVGARGDDLTLGDRDERLAIEPGDHVEQQCAARGIELARHVVEQEDWGVAEAGAHLRQLGQLERQHQRPELPLRGVGAGQRPGEADLQVVGLGPEAGEAAPFVERPALGEAPPERGANPRLVG